eukprot:NODE_742_length_1476_cov_103.078486_g614_i0.p1 GENE.NODE_742_length_1476_cov_103.078486_g614_i0~~NODE_742_length_1476_cov_103.078486_g614_i0.p1  ORF type:complete len:400 (+),score=51.18 NODE_742_length_1476_cov_103.078486_g614_i0:66-1265(+)
MKSFLLLVFILPLQGRPVGTISIANPVTIAKPANCNTLMGVFHLPTKTLWGCYTSGLEISDRDDPLGNPVTVAKPGGGHVWVVVDYGSKSYWGTQGFWYETDLHSNTNGVQKTAPCGGYGTYNHPPYTYTSCGATVVRTDLLTNNNPLVIGEPAGCGTFANNIMIFDDGMLWACYINGMKQTDLDANTGLINHGGPPGCNGQPGLRGNFVDGATMYWACQTEMYTTTYVPGVIAHIIGDPHFLSFGGGIFDIIGVVGAIYLIWVDEFLRWNARFVARRSNPSRGTQLGECGLVFPNATTTRPDHDSFHQADRCDSLLNLGHREVPMLPGPLHEGCQVHQSAYFQTRNLCPSQFLPLQCTGLKTLFTGMQAAWPTGTDLPLQNQRQPKGSEWRGRHRRHT